MEIYGKRAASSLTGLALVVILSCPGLVKSQVRAGYGGRADVIRHISIYESPSEYCAWPSIARTSERDLVVLFTRTEEHLGPNGDLGYPASVELERGIILTVYYQPNVPAGTIQRMDPPDPHRTKPGILGTIWRVPPVR